MNSTIAQVRFCINAVTGYSNEQPRVDFSDKRERDLQVFLEKTGIRYILRSSLNDKSNRSGILGPFIYAYEKDIHYPFSVDESRWIKYSYETSMIKKFNTHENY